MSEKKTGPLDELTPAQKARLKQVESSIGLEGVTVSFSIDGERDGLGRRKSAFNNARSVPLSNGGTWTREEVQAVRIILSKDVVVATYRDAVFRGFMAKGNAADEVGGIISHYDKSLARLMKRESESESESDPGHGTTGTKCEDCGEPQIITPSGVSCPNGHGGAGSLSEGDIVDASVDEAAQAASDDELAAMLGDLP